MTPDETVERAKKMPMAARNERGEYFVFSTELAVKVGGMVPHAYKMESVEDAWLLCNLLEKRPRCNAFALYTLLTGKRPRPIYWPGFYSSVCYRELKCQRSL